MPLLISSAIGCGLSVLLIWSMLIPCRSLNLVKISTIHSSAKVVDNYWNYNCNICIQWEIIVVIHSALNKFIGSLGHTLTWPSVFIKFASARYLCTFSSCFMVLGSSEICILDSFCSFIALVLDIPGFHGVMEFHQDSRRICSMKGASNLETYYISYEWPQWNWKHHNIIQWNTTRFLNRGSYQ